VRRYSTSCLGCLSCLRVQWRTRYCRNLATPPNPHCGQSGSKSLRYPLQMRPPSRLPRPGHQDSFSTWTGAFYPHLLPQSRNSANQPVTQAAHISILSMPDELDLHQDHQLPSHDPASLLDPHADFPPPDTPSQHGQPAIQPVPPNVGANLGASLPPTTLGPSSTPRKDNFSVLSRIPVDVREFRERVFRLDEPATFDAHQWDLYWP